MADIPSPQRTQTRPQLSAEANEFIGKLMDNRGAILLAFAQVEWFLAKLIIEASKYEQYQAIDLSFFAGCREASGTSKEGPQR